MRESELQAAVMDLAAATGWYVHHSRTARVARRDGSIYYATALSGNPGFPDLTLVHKKRPNMIVAELKSDSGRLSDVQKDWLGCLQRVAAAALSVRVAVWFPHDLLDGSIRDLLLRGWEVET